jgi:membrane protein implicated in regulation of membrane protease activity
LVRQQTGDGLDRVAHVLAAAEVAVRARFGLLDGVGSLLLFGGLLLTLMVAESWFWLAFVGFDVMAAVYALKGVHWLRARHRPRPDQNDRL